MGEHKSPLDPPIDRRGAAPTSAVLLAAGRSERFGGGFGDLLKQLAEFRGEPLVRRAARTALAADFAEILVVTGYHAEAVEAALQGLDVTFVRNPNWEEGQSTSVKAGLARVDSASRAALFLPCDQPLLTAKILDRILGTYRETGGPIVLPAYGDRRGSPVLLARSLFPELAKITGDTGGRQVIRRYPDAVVEVRLESEGPLVDVDTLEALKRLGAATPEK